MRLLSDRLKANLALFFAGFVTFSTIYTFQPLFPNLVEEFAVSPAIASLSLSFTTFALALALPISGSLSDAWGRRGIMGLAVIIGSLLALLAASDSSLSTLLMVRLVQGVVLAGNYTTTRDHESLPNVDSLLAAQQKLPLYPQF